MSNYKLTTDLIADCMALIPQNALKLNGRYSVNSHKGEHIFNNLTIENIIKDINLNYNFISHCLRTIPEFQKPAPIETLSMVKPALLQAGHERGLAYEPKTIASAALHGQSEFPPSTLEELCESYKKVMS